MTIDEIDKQIHDLRRQLRKLEREREQITKENQGDSHKWSLIKKDNFYGDQLVHIKEN